MSKPNQKRRLPSLARLHQAARRYRSGTTDALRKSMVSLSLSDYERKGLEKLVRRNSTTLGVELHRAIDTHIRSDGLPPVQLMNAFVARFNAALDRNNKALEKRLRKAMKTRASSPQKPRQPRSTAGRRR